MLSCIGPALLSSKGVIHTVFYVKVLLELGSEQPAHLSMADLAVPTLSGLAPGRELTLTSPQLAWGRTQSWKG